MGRAIVGVLALTACRGDGGNGFPGGGSNLEHTQETSEPPPILLEEVTGLVPEEGFGTSVAIDGDALLVGAPFAGGRVYAVELYGDGTPTVLLEGSELEAPTLGASIAGTLARFVAGAPIAQRAIDQDGVVVAAGEEGLGLAVAVDGDRWVAAHGGGWRSSDGASEATADRPSSLALDGETIVVGFAHGETIAATTGTEAIARAPGVNEDGFAVAVLEGIVAHGDPASATVVVGDRTLTGGGRFGAALAVGDVTGDGEPDLVVGAPMDAGGAGSVALYAGPDLDAVSYWEGDAAGANLGTSIAASGGLVVAGAPGAPGTAGAIKIFRVE